MKFSTSLVKFGSVGDLALELKKALTAIAAGWNVEHHPDGTHKAITTDGISERGRSVAMGEWTDFTPTLTASAGTVSVSSVLSCRYTLVGKTLTVTFYLGITLSATPANLVFTLPGGAVAATITANVLLDGTGTALMFQTINGSATANLYRNAAGSGTWPTGAQTIAGTLTVPIS